MKNPALKTLTVKRVKNEQFKYVETGTTKDYKIPGGKTVQVGPRAGVMAPQPPSSAAQSFKQYGRF